MIVMDLTLSSWSLWSLWSPVPLGQGAGPHAPEGYRNFRTLTMHRHRLQGPTYKIIYKAQQVIQDVPFSKRFRKFLPTAGLDEAGTVSGSRPRQAGLLCGLAL